MLRNDCCLEWACDFDPPIYQLFQAAKAAAQKPQDRQVRVQLIKVAQALQKATELYRTKMVQKLASAALTHHAKGAIRMRDAHLLS